MFNKKIIFMGLLIVTIFLGAGCVDGQVDIKINGDGSGDLSYAMIVDKRTYDPELLEEYIGILKENLFTVEQKDMGEIIIINASVYLPKFRTIFDPTVVLGNEEGRIAVDYSRKWLSTEYFFDISYDIDKTKEFIIKELDIPEAKFNSMAFSVRLPNEAGENNSNEQKSSENMYTWKINNSGVTDIKLSTKTINKINLIITIGVPLFAGIAYYKERKKERKPKVIRSKVILWMKVIRLR